MTLAVEGYLQEALLPERRDFAVAVLEQRWATHWERVWWGVQMVGGWLGAIRQQTHPLLPQKPDRRVGE
jgi:hypothetical protein